MHYWLHVIFRAGGDTVDYFMQGGYMTGVAIFLIAVFLVRLKKGRQTMEEWIEDGMFGFWATVIWFGIYFVAHVLYFSPSAIYREQNQAVIDESNQVVSLTTQLRLAQNPSDQKIIQWQPPKMTNDTPGIEIYCGGQFLQNGSGKMFYGTPVDIPIDEFRTNKNIIIPVQGYPAISISLVKNRLYLDLFVPTKLKPIQIEANESSPLPEGWDWNSDSNTLEIVDDQNQAVFQEIYFDPNHVWIRGAIQSGGDVIELPVGGWMGSAMRHGFYNSAELQLTTIFLYSSSKHPHEKIPN